MEKLETLPHVLLEAENAYIHRLGVYMPPCVWVSVLNLKSEMDCIGPTSELVLVGSCSAGIFTFTWVGLIESNVLCDPKALTRCRTDPFSTKNSTAYKQELSSCLHGNRD